MYVINIFAKCHFAAEKIITILVYYLFLIESQRSNR